MKRWFSICLAAVMLISTMSFTVFGASEGYISNSTGDSSGGATCSYGMDDSGTMNRKTDSVGKTLYIAGNSLNNKVFPLSQAPFMDYVFTFNNVVFSNYLGHSMTYTQDINGSQILVCNIDLGIGGSMRAKGDDVEFMLFKDSMFNTVPSYLSGYSSFSDLVTYKTNTPCMTKKDVYTYLDSRYVKPYVDGGRNDNGHWNKGLTWEFVKNPNKVRSNGTYLDTFLIRVDEGKKVSYFQINVSNKTDYKGKKVVEDSQQTQQGQNEPVSYPLVATAKPTASKILINGKEVKFEAYNINDNNYFKLRDVALSLRGTEKQFEVVWNPSFREGNIRGAIEMKSYSPYTTVGGEMALGNGFAKTAKLTNSPILKDGEKVTKLVGYNISDNNFFKLRDLGELFDFNVSWDGKLNTIIINTSESYDPSN